MPLDSPTNTSAENTLSESKLTYKAPRKESKSEKEMEDGLARLPKLGDPDDVLEKYIKQLDCYKISDMSEHELKHMNALLARKVAPCDATEKKTAM